MSDPTEVSGRRAIASESGPAPTRVDAFVSPAALADARERYRTRTGRDVPGASLDLSAASPRRALRGFLHRGPSEQWASEGEWLALELGVKPVLRELVRPAEWASRRAGVEARGLTWELLPHEIAASPGGGRIVAAAATPEALRSLHVGRDAASVREAAEIDRALIVDGDPPEVRRTMIRRHGELLGYPTCCSAAFADLLVTAGNDGPLAAAARRTSHFDYRLNVASPSLLHLISHYPCRFDCDVSLALARHVEAALVARDPVRAHAATQLLARPRLYLDDRCQILIDGYATGPGRVRYRGLTTPFAHDRRVDDAALELVFYVDQVAPLRGGDTLEIDTDTIVVRNAGAVVARRPRPPGLLWLPFGGPTS